MKNGTGTKDRRAPRLIREMTIMVNADGGKVRKGAALVAKKLRKAIAKKSTKRKRPLVQVANTPPGWWITCPETPVRVFVPDIPKDRWFDARASGVALLCEALKRSVSQDAVSLEWRE